MKLIVIIWYQLTATPIRARLICLLLALVVAGVGIAVFSPLHKHERGSHAKCSLGHVDAQQSEGAVAACQLPTGLDFAVHTAVETVDSRPQTESRSISARGPPSFFS